MNIVIIGAGASGLTAASNIRKYDEESQIIVFTTQKNVAYSPCAIPYVIGGHIDSFDDIIMHKPGEYMQKNIRVITETEVTEIDKDIKEVTYKSKNATVDEKVKYDKLIIATGGTPLMPPIPGKDLEGVFKVRTVEDGEEILKYSQDVENVTLVGGGAIGLELGSELANKGIKVTIAEMMPQLFPRSFDKEMSDKFQEHLEEKNVTILTSSAVESINGDEKVESVTIDGQQRPADMVILSTGVRAETKLAESIGCKLGRFAIEVDEHMETSVKDVYAAGDCVEVVSAITGEKTPSPLGTTAVRQGIILAKHLTGHDIEFKPVLNSTVSQIGRMEMGAVGITQQEAENMDIDVVVSNIESLSKARYYPGSKPLYLKLIAKLDGTIIGCQMFGQEAVAERVDTMTAIISQKLKCSEVVSMEFSYAPPVSQVIDPIAQAAGECLEKIEEINDAKVEDCQEAENCDVCDKADDCEIKPAEEPAKEECQKDEEPAEPKEPTVSFTQQLRENNFIQ
ncbi:MAG: FAD-dependent oxidoreductase [Methanosphaera sp.]|uniref:NAD(P)/FAD-dependent oxidoreductase n=1 Tax=Methanosphaera sp. TaxID=2666342 RepID=UPI0025DFD0CE|nr:FAD-dependent oxidoreductase [Methanosphaera sp.]MCI5866871.1 FAD-dependent oxidoreductase [Methanosphaera sp.]MDD6534378.1 FAD-dependent oxidoreductase [Methanosphaera sp.]MDY3955217.1 FAD-dependent oxidoreductase [Methanosphaera sp.]